MSRVLSWLKDESNRAAITLIGGALAATIGGLWAAYLHFFAEPEPKPKPAPIQVESDCGSVAVGGNVSGGTITAGASGDCAKPAPKTPP